MNHDTTPERTQDCVVLYSGGPDSLISLRWAETNANFWRVIPVYFDLGHRYAAHERHAVLNTRSDRPVIIDQTLKGIGVREEADAHICGRNAFLAGAAAYYLPRGGTIVLTVQKDELDLPDRSPEFLADMSRILRTLGRGWFEVVTPWLSMDKTAMVTWYLKADYLAGDLLATRSCYRTEELQCGDCPACFRRAVAFRLNGIEERYAQDPFQSATAAAYREKALAGRYSSARCRRILEALGGAR